MRLNRRRALALLAAAALIAVTGPAVSEHISRVPSPPAGKAGPRVTPPTAGTTVPRSPTPMVGEIAPDGGSMHVVTVPTDNPQVSATFGCPKPFLATAYGPLCRGILTFDGLGWVCFHSPLKGNFNCQGGELPVLRTGGYEITTGFGTVTRGWATLKHPAHGEIGWPTQYKVYDTDGRWGTYTFRKREAGSGSAWQPTVK